MSIVKIVSKTVGATRNIINRKEVKVDKKLARNVIKTAKLFAIMDKIEQLVVRINSIKSKKRVAIRKDIQLLTRICDTVEKEINDLFKEEE